jgi:hypothetical protein
VLEWRGSLAVGETFPRIGKQRPRFFQALEIFAVLLPRLGNLLNEEIRKAGRRECPFLLS